MDQTGGGQIKVMDGRSRGAGDVRPEQASVNNPLSGADTAAGSAILCEIVGMSFVLLAEGQGTCQWIAVRLQQEGNTMTTDPTARVEQRHTR